MLIHAERMLHQTGHLGPGWVRVDGPTITDTGHGDPPTPGGRSDGRSCVATPLLAPGFVDLHCHGAAGASFTGGREAALRVAAAHADQGTTTVMASLVTAPLGLLARQVAELAELVQDGLLGGVHLEGPWLSPRFAGAHDPAHLRPPDRAAVDALLSAGRGAVRMVTVAPELPGATEAIRALVDAGVLAAVGHTDTDAGGLRAAVDAGASVVTHLFNAMRPLHHRAPGPVVAALADDRVTVELIADGLHVHPDVLSLAWRGARGPVALVTDAMAAALAGDGDYRLGSLDVRVSDGVARLTHSGAIAGSTVTMHQAVRRAVDAGVPLAEALVAATRTPADRLLRTDIGRLAPGARADVVCLGENLEPVAVMRAGQWLPR